jgi:hypothetical protein
VWSDCQGRLRMLGELVESRRFVELRIEERVETVLAGVRSRFCAASISNDRHWPRHTKRMLQTFPRSKPNSWC